MTYPYRDVVAALVEAGALAQVGWRCDQETSSDRQTHLCAHPWPCGPTYAVAARPEHTGDKGDPAVGRALLEQGTLPRPARRLVVNVDTTDAVTGDASAPDVVEHLGRLAGAQLARTLAERDVAHRADNARDALLWHYLLHDLSEAGLQPVLEAAQADEVHPHVVDALASEIRRRRMDRLRAGVDVPAGTDDDARHATTTPPSQDRVTVAVDLATDDPAMMVLGDWPDGSKVVLNAAGEPCAVQVPWGTVAPGSTGAWWQGFASHYLRADQPDHDPETCTWCVRTAQDLGVPLTSLSAPEPPTEPPDEHATADGPHEQLTVDQVDGSGHTPADCPGHDCPWHCPF